MASFRDNSPRKGANSSLSQARSAGSFGRQRMAAAGGIAGATSKVAAAKVTIDLQVSNDGLDGGAAAHLALDGIAEAPLGRK